MAVVAAAAVGKPGSLATGRDVAGIVGRANGSAARDIGGKLKGSGLGRLDVMANEIGAVFVGGEARPNVLLARLFRDQISKVGRRAIKDADRAEPMPGKCGGAGKIGSPAGRRTGGQHDGSQQAKSDRMVGFMFSAHGGFIGSADRRF